MEKGTEIRSAIEELSVVTIKVKPVADLDRDHNAPQIPIKPFLFLCNLVIQVLDKIGPTMAVLRQDIYQNIQRLERIQESDPTLYSDVVEILKKEVTEGNAKKGHSCSKAFVWLTRSLDFMVTLLQLIAKDSGLNMEQAVEESYIVTLKPWHGWISSTAYRVALKLVPDNKTLIAILMGKDEDQDTLKEDIETLTSLVVPLLDEIHSILIRYDLDRLKSA